MPTRTASKTFAALQKLINHRLKEIGEVFAIRHLAKGPDGKFRFELSVAIGADQSTVLKQVLREVLKELPAETNGNVPG
jgi:hypothetical protein